ncbi:hypothetical protein PFISCL1PPCAC_5054, partial [Pristionchus fissidentatus]
YLFSLFSLFFLLLLFMLFSVLSSLSDFTFSRVSSSSDLDWYCPLLILSCLSCSILSFFLRSSDLLGGLTSGYGLFLLERSLGSLGGESSFLSSSFFSSSFFSTFTDFCSLFFSSSLLPS